MIHRRTESPRIRCLAIGLGTLICLAVAWSLPRGGFGQEAAGVGPRASVLDAAPFDRITLTDGAVIDVDPVSPRPLPAYDPKQDRKAEKDSRPPPEGNIFLPGEKPKGSAPEEKEAVPGEIAIHLLAGEVRDFKVKRTSIKRIDYFEDLLLAEGDRYRIARDYARAFECALRVRMRDPDWPGLRENVDRLLFDEGSAALLAGDDEHGLRILRELAMRRPDYPGLADKLATAYGGRITRAFEIGLYALGRKVLHDLEPLAPDHPVVRESRERFIGRAQALVNESSRHEGAGRLDRLSEALRVWPESPGAGARYDEAFSALPTLDVAVVDPPRAVGPRVRCPADERVWRLLYLPILASDDEESARGKRPGQLAARLESAELGRRLTLQVRPDIPWSDGSRTVSAIDVARALVARTEPRSPSYSARWADLLERVEVLDDRRLEFRLARPFLKPEAWLIVPVGPAHAGADGRLESPGRGLTVVADGPYRWTSAGDRGIDLQAPRTASNEDRPRVARIRETRYAGARAAIGALVRGEVSMVGHVPPDRVAELSANRDLRVGRYARPAVHLIALDGRNPALRNRTLRRALSYAIDRKALLEETLLRRVADADNRVADGPFARGSYADAIDVKPLSHDPLLAKMLVGAARKELGGDPIKLTLEYPASPEPQAVVTKLVEAFTLAGVEVVAIERPESELETELRAGRRFEMAYRATRCDEPVLEAGGLICPGIDAPPAADALSSLASPRILQHLLQLERAPEWPTAKGLSLQIDRECRDELPILPLWQLEEHYAWRARLTGPSEVADRLYEGVETWEIAPWFARDPW